MTAAVFSHHSPAYIDAAAHAAVREAVSLLVDGDPDLALWALIRETTRLAGISESTTPLGEAHADWCMAWNRHTSVVGKESTEHDLEAADA